MDYSLTGSSVHGILQARIQEWTAMPSFRGLFPIQELSLCLQHLLHWQTDSLPRATQKASIDPHFLLKLSYLFCVYISNLGYNFTCVYFAVC